MSETIQRFDDITSLVDANSRVLDLGCGNGDLLQTLKQKKHILGYGIEINSQHILSCIEKGISVFQADINEGLKGFSDNVYDYVILSETIQQVKNPKFILNEMLRVGKKGIVVFPNFAYWKIRLQLLFGITPKTKTLPYSWDDTPNIRVVTVYEFKKLCESQGFTIIHEIPQGKFSFLGKHFSNLFYKKAMFVLEKK